MLGAFELRDGGRGCGQSSNAADLDVETDSAHPRSLPSLSSGLEYAAEIEVAADTTPGSEEGHSTVRN